MSRPPERSFVTNHEWASQFLNRPKASEIVKTREAMRPIIDSRHEEQKRFLRTQQRATRQQHAELLKDKANKRFIPVQLTYDRSNLATPLLSDSRLEEENRRLAMHSRCTPGVPRELEPTSLFDMMAKMRDENLLPDMWKRPDDAASQHSAATRRSSQSVRRASSASVADSTHSRRARGPLSSLQPLGETGVSAAASPYLAPLHAQKSGRPSTVCNGRVQTSLSSQRLQRFRHDPEVMAALRLVKERVSSLESASVNHWAESANATRNVSTAIGQMRPRRCGASAMSGRPPLGATDNSRADERPRSPAAGLYTEDGFSLISGASGR